MSANEWHDSVRLGEVLKIRGIKGDLLVKTHLQLAPDFEIPESVFLRIEGLLVPFFIEEYELLSTSSLLIRPRLAPGMQLTELTGCEVLLPAAEVSEKPVNKKKRGKEEGQFFSDDSWVGMALADEKGKILGRIQDVIDIPGNPLISVLCGEEELLIPAHPDLVVKIDRKARCVFMTIPDGLMSSGD